MLDVIAVVLLLILLVGFAFQCLFLWLGTLMFKISGASFRRVLLACTVIMLADLALAAGGFAVGVSLLDLKQDVRLAQCSLLLIGTSAVQFLVAVLCVKWLLRASFGRAVLASLFMFVAVPAAVMLAAVPLHLAVLEGFSVPTGAMAPTIYGAHADVTCENCGTQYALNMTQWASPGNSRPREPLMTACLNCGQHNRVPARQPIRAGDQILVDKTGDPRRWDIIVFKYPEDPSVNFVKRLVGMPNETLEIAGGEIFIEGTRLRKPPGMVADMWLPVHDSKRVPETPCDGPRWEAAEPSSGWEYEAGKWTFDPQRGPSAALAFSGPFTGRLAYNSWVAAEIPLPDADPLPISDVKIECAVEHLSGGGSLSFVWQFGAREVTATVSADGRVELAASHAQQDGEETATGRLPKVLSAGKRIALACRDGQAYLMQEGVVAASLDVGPEDLEAFEQMLRQSPGPCGVRLVAAGGSVTLGEIVLYNDVYYRTLGEIPGIFPALAGEIAPKRISLGEGEFFTLGENSSASKDSRFWGAVGRRAVVGVARWRYWPPNRWHEFH